MSKITDELLSNEVALQGFPLAADRTDSSVDSKTSTHPRSRSLNPKLRVRGKSFFKHYFEKGIFDTAADEDVAVSYLNSPRTPFYHYLIYTGMAVTIQLILGWSYAFPDGRPACSDDPIDGTPQNTIMCGLQTSFQLAHMQLRFLDAIVLGGYVVSTVSLWRLRRTSYVALCGASRNLIIQVATLIPDSDDEAATKSKLLMERWVMLGYELAILKARGEMDSDYGRKYLQAQGLLSGEEEWNNMAEGDRHTTVWYWIQRKAVSLAEEGVISSELRLQTLCSAVTLIRGKAGDLMSPIDRDQPLACTSAVDITVFFSVATMSLWKGVQWAIWFYDTNGMIWTEPRMYVEITVLALYTTIFAVLVDIDKILYNPFGHRKLDIPHKVVGGGLKNLAIRLGTSTRCFPPDDCNNLDQFMGEEQGNQVDVQANVEHCRAEVFGGWKRGTSIAPHGYFKRITVQRHDDIRDTSHLAEFAWT